MGFIKVVKNKAYFKRFQVKFRRRREAKTDYRARKRLITQDKNKYATPKYRLVVRFTNKDIVAQIFSSDLDHDVCLASAYAHELKRYGLKVGFTNYAAAYATGLLLARRVNVKYGLSELYEGNKEINGEDYNVTEDADENERSPFKALLDVGLKRTTTGARVFGALKGATDGGIDVPHKDRRFPGSAKSEEEGKKYEPNADKHREYIFGIHVATYMKKLKAEDNDLYQRQFKGYLAAGVDADGIEGSYKKLHAAIRADPAKKRGALELGHFKVRKEPKKEGTTYPKPKKPFHRVKVSNAQRKGRIQQKLQAKFKKEAAATGAQA
jgi:large subunit ribosomal protein L5e